MPPPFASVQISIQYCTRYRLLQIHSICGRFKWRSGFCFKFEGDYRHALISLDEDDENHSDAVREDYAGLLGGEFKSGVVDGFPSGSTRHRGIGPTRFRSCRQTNFLDVDVELVLLCVLHLLKNGHHTTMRECLLRITMSMLPLLFAYNTIVLCMINFQRRSAESIFLS
jgi:hypothetical protein